MMRVDKNTVAAFYVNEKIICANCMTEADWKPLTRERVITRNQADENDKIFFCDRCDEPI